MSEQHTTGPVDLDDAETRATWTREWIFENAELHDELVPFQVIEHVNHDWPGVVAALRAARKVVEASRRHKGTLHSDQDYQAALAAYDQAVGDGVS